MLYNISNDYTELNVRKAIVNVLLTNFPYGLRHIFLDIAHTKNDGELYYSSLFNAEVLYDMCKEILNFFSSQPTAVRGSLATEYFLLTKAVADYSSNNCFNFETDTKSVNQKQTNIISASENKRNKYELNDWAKKFVNKMKKAEYDTHTLINDGVSETDNSGNNIYPFKIKLHKYISRDGYSEFYENYDEDFGGVYLFDEKGDIEESKEKNSGQ